MFCTAGSSPGMLRPFYSGVEVSDRMAEVRKAIGYVRTHWSEYQSFVRDLRISLDNVMENLTSLSDLIPPSREWADRQSLDLPAKDD